MHAMPFAMSTFLWFHFTCGVSANKHYYWPISYEWIWWILCGYHAFWGSRRIWESFPLVSFCLGFYCLLGQKFQDRKTTQLRKRNLIFWNWVKTVLVIILRLELYIALALEKKEKDSSWSDIETFFLPWHNVQAIKGQSKRLLLFECSVLSRLKIAHKQSSFFPFGYHWLLASFLYDGAGGKKGIKNVFSSEACVQWSEASEGSLFCLCTEYTWKKNP